MQSNSPFSTPPPIPTPDGNLPPVQPRDTNVVRGDWKTAPSIVRGGAYPLTWLGIVFSSIFIFLSLMFMKRTDARDIFILSTFAVLLAVSIWLNRAYKKGLSSAWTVQTVLSGFAVLSSVRILFSRPSNLMVGVLIGVAIHAYILSQWFKPETKAWFGKS